MNLEKINIYELRTYGRHVGVKAPTTLKRKELIEAIRQIELGVAKPHKTTKGRPLKQSIKNKVMFDYSGIDKELTQIKNELLKIIEQVDGLLTK